MDPFCRIDAAHDMCVTASNQLNELRETLSKYPGMKELKNQLLNLNLFLASSDTQTSCAQTYAKGLIDGGDIELGSSHEAIGWDVDAPQALDPEDGWPWFRNISTSVLGFGLKGAAATGVSCQDAGLGALQSGTLQGGRLLVANGKTSSEARLKGGRVDIREAECDVDACAFELAALELTVASFELDGMRLTDVSAVLVEPARGKLHGELVRISGSKVELDVRGQVDGDEQTHRVRAQGDVLARRTAEGRFAIEALRMGDGPVTAELSTDPVRTAPSAAAR